MTIKVRQKQHAIAKMGMSSTTLETKDIRTCTGLIGVHSSRKVAFMAHFDTPFSVRGLTLLAKELERDGYRFSDFKLFKVAGIAPSVTYSGLALFLIMPLLLWMWSVHDFWAWFYLVSIPLLIWGMSGMTRTCLWLQLMCLKASSALPRFCGVTGESSLFGACNVTFDLAYDEQPKVTKADKVRDPDFDAHPLPKAEGSA
ncbi:hypothetical protein [Chromobacterium haemolyticum]|uniref:hypothetical protein n=1 Tax=Chromobacterium haemolyticum TaxID=394935 RepID=UPI002449FD89|nr:hypothetical protein [Chromobacterium haemolyticum]MDH0343424.1 hypothetical protein [Chromobacterium haemolyticum]